MRTHGIAIALARSGGRVLAISTEERMFNELNETLRTNFTQQRERADNLEAALEAVQAQINGGAGAVGLIGSPLPVDPSYTTAFASYFRRGDGEDALKVANATGDRAIVQNAMSVGTNTDGGYLAPVEWDRKLQERQRATSPMRRLATVRTTTVGAYSTLWNLDQWGSGWVGETAARPNTTATSLAPIIFAAGEIYAMPAATQRLLDDAALNVENWLAESVEREFNRQEGIAFLSGDGSNKPAGFLTYVDGGANENTHPGGALEVVEADIDLDALTDFLYGLGAPYRQNATWLMSSQTAAFIAKIKDADGRPIWRESLIVGQPATLLGRPVEIDEGMPAPTAGNLAIAFGDFRAGYLINDRIGTRVLRDPYTNKPYVNFYVTKRVGGGVLDPFAIRLLRVAA
ncbi:phage major capsid protein [uncultured Sphingomonas sp.]|uniref:phage major capsid protein n=1 Tax=unclassified Sphingomonas TaxID=196159 RepID=UPI0025FB69AC|nr:phage major capsid protein [uncultured Sphingomonas sp.]